MKTYMATPRLGKRVSTRKVTRVSDSVKPRSPNGELELPSGSESNSRYRVLEARASALGTYAPAQPEPFEEAEVLEQPRVSERPKISERLRTDASAVAAVVVLVLATIQLFAGAFTTGPSLDELAHLDRAQSWLDTGFYVPPQHLLDGRPDEREAGSTPFVYGPAYSALAHAANVVLGNEPSDQIEEYGGSVQSASSVDCLPRLPNRCCCRADRVLADSLSNLRSMGDGRSASDPRLDGAQLLQRKDIPAAAGYTFLTAGLVVALQTDEDQPAGRVASGLDSRPARSRHRDRHRNPPPPSPRLPNFPCCFRRAHDPQTTVDRNIFGPGHGSCRCAWCLYRLRRGHALLSEHQDFAVDFPRPFSRRLIRLRMGRCHSYGRPHAASAASLVVSAGLVPSFAAGRHGTPRRLGHAHARSSARPS